MRFDAYSDHGYHSALWCTVSTGIRGPSRELVAVKSPDMETEFAQLLCTQHSGDPLF